MFTLKNRYIKYAIKSLIYLYNLFIIIVDIIRYVSYFFIKYLNIES